MTDFPWEWLIGVFFAKPGFDADSEAKNIVRMRSCTDLSTQIVDKGKILVRHRLARGTSTEGQLWPASRQAPVDEGCRRRAQARNR